MVAPFPHSDLSRATFALDKICVLATEPRFCSCLYVCVCVYVRACVYRVLVCICAIFLQEVDRLLGNFAVVYARCNCGGAVHRERSNGFAATATAVGDIQKFVVSLF